MSPFGKTFAMPPAQTVLGKILRWPFSLIPPETVVRILRGPLRGKKWVAGAGPNAYWVGRYEVARLREFAATLTQGGVVYDVGASVGIYSLVASSEIGPTGMVYAFEPQERNLGYLRRHLALNRVNNCFVLEAAVCNRDGTRRFSSAAWDACMGRLSDDGEISVPSTTIDTCVYGETGLRPPDILKVDVEGAELEVLEGAAKTLGEFHPRAFVETHGTQLHADCCAYLQAKGYTVRQKYCELTATWRASA